MEETEETGEKGWKRLKMIKNLWKYTKMDENGWKWIKVDKHRKNINNKKQKDSELGSTFWNLGWKFENGPNSEN